MVAISEILGLLRMELIIERKLIQKRQQVFQARTPQREVKPRIDFSAFKIAQKKARFASPEKNVIPKLKSRINHHRNLTRISFIFLKSLSIVPNS